MLLNVIFPFFEQMNCIRRSLVLHNSKHLKVKHFRIFLRSSSSNFISKKVTVNDIYQSWTKKFNDKLISEADVSAEYIISHVLKRETFCGLDLNQLLSTSELEKINFLCKKRCAKIPIQYILEEWDFGGLTLKMIPPVFIPRPETQGLVNIVLEELNTSSLTNFKLLEVGCGTGAITLALLNARNQRRTTKQLDITAIDKNIDAIHLSQLNAKITNIQDFKLVHCDIALLSTHYHFSGIFSNPPYVPAKEMKQLQPEIRQYESHLALDGGEDGLDVIRDIVKVAEFVLSVHGWIWLEVDTNHPEILQNLFNNFQLTEVRKDYLDRDRFVKLVKVS